MTIGGVAQILLLSGSGRDQRRAGRRHAALAAHMEAGVRIVQPALTADGDVLMTSGATGWAESACGASRSRTDRADGRAEERWTSTRAEAVLQRLRRSQGPCLRLRRQHPRMHRPRRTASASGRAAATATASSSCCPTRTCCWCCRKKASWRWSRPRPISSRSSRGSRRSRARPGTIRRWSATSCWFATARRWPRFGWPSRAMTILRIFSMACMALGRGAVRPPIRTRLDLTGRPELSLSQPPVPTAIAMSLFQK